MLYINIYYATIMLQALLIDFFWRLACTLPALINENVHV